MAHQRPSVTTTRSPSSAIAERLNAAMAVAAVAPDREAAMLAVLQGADCYQIAIMYASAFVKGAEVGERDEKAIDLALDTLEPMFRHPGLFNGKAKFTSFLYSCLRTASKAAYRTKVTKSIWRLGFHAPLVLELIVRDGWSDSQILIHLRSLMSMETAESLLQSVHERIGNDSASYADRFGAASRPFSSFGGEADGEGSDLPERLLADLTVEDPLERLLDSEKVRVLRGILDRLGPTERKLMEDYVMNDRLKTRKEAAAVLGIKNPAYVEKKTADMIRKAFEKEYE